MRFVITLFAVVLTGLSFVAGDGWDGFASAAPYDAINVAAAIGDGVLPAALERQLAPGGRLIAPVGSSEQRLMLTRRTPDGLVRSELEGVRFVPLVRD